MGPECRVVRRVEAGAGEPAVVLEAGLNHGAASWQQVMPLLAPHLRVAAYDRAGIGGSAPAPGLVTIDRQIDDLASVITGLAAGPCVLAVHKTLAQGGLQPGPEQHPAGPDGPRTSWLTDPDGYRIELVQWPPGHPDGISAADFA